MPGSKNRPSLSYSQPLHPHQFTGASTGIDSADGTLPLAEVSIVRHDLAGKHFLQPRRNAPVSGNQMHVCNVGIRLRWRDRNRLAQLRQSPLFSISETVK